jgi:hypothetical protein
MIRGRRRARNGKQGLAAAPNRFKEGGMSRHILMTAGVFLCLTLASSAQAPSPDAMSVARSLVTTMKLGDQYKALLPVILLSLKPTLVQDRPEIERDYDAMTAMIADTYTPFYNEMLEGAAAVYTANFTTDEMRQIEAFYRLPVGQKLLERSQGIVQQTTQIGRDVGRKAADAIKLRLTDALRQKGHKL